MDLGFDSCPVREAVGIVAQELLGRLNSLLASRAANLDRVERAVLSVVNTFPDLKDGEPLASPGAVARFDLTSLIGQRRDRRTGLISPSVD
jgi:hypothetical protein